MSARFESLCRPVTPVPTGSPAGRNGVGGGSISPTSTLKRQSPHPEEGTNGEATEGAELGSASSWGFASADVAAIDPGVDVVSFIGGEGGAETAAAAAMAVEIAALKEENASLKKELKRARAEIKRLAGDVSGVGGGGGRQATRDSSSGGGIATSLSAGGLLQENRLEESLERGGVGSGRDGRKGRQSRTSRESRSRKQIDLDNARATDAVVEAVVEGGVASPMRSDSGHPADVG